MEIKKILGESEIIKSQFTKTGKFYIHNKRIVLELVTSTNNVWVDDEYANELNVEEFKQLEQDVREFFNGKVRNVGTLSLNKVADDLFSDLEEALNLVKSETEKSGMVKTVELFKTYYGR